MFSIITACLNAEEKIYNTLLSVSSQNFNDYEHIVKDGVSKDQTYKIVEKLKNSNLKFYCSKDCGVYDAFNQAINYSSKQYINFLGAGDIFDNKKILSKVKKRINETDCDLIYGNLEIVKLINGSPKVIRKWKAGEFNKKKLFFGWMPPHPTVFIKKSLLEQVGCFNKNFYISGDYDLLMKILSSNKIKVEYLDETLVKMDSGGLSQSGYIKSFIEDTKIGINHGNFLMPLFKRLRKLNQFQILNKKNKL